MFTRQIIKGTSHYALLLCIILIHGRNGLTEIGQNESASLVLNGNSVSIIVLPDNPQSFEQSAAEDFSRYVYKASGAVLDIIAESEALNDDRCKVYIGDTWKAAEKGMSSSAFSAEQFRIYASETEVILNAAKPNKTSSEAPMSIPLFWAIGEILEKDLGVRWLWPGDVGTYIPENTNVVITVRDFTCLPQLELRSFRNSNIRKLDKNAKIPGRDGRPHVDTPPELYQKLSAEMDVWLRYHRIGSRCDVTFGHAFTDWWDRYGETNPDLFALPPSGASQPFPARDRVKLRVGNPEVDEMILKEWLDAGSPQWYNICPNDGGGFCIAPESMAMDVPAGQDIQEIWNGSSYLTARYIKFWNRLIEKFRIHRPDVELCTYAYSRYADPPPDGVFLEKGILVGMVPTFDEEFYEQWDGFFRAGAARMVLRPNWLNHGSTAPYLPLEEIGSAIKHATETGMSGAIMSGFHGAWGMTGLKAYLVVRLLAHPELEIDDVLEEYCIAFGPAASYVKAYIDYWMNFALEAAYPFPRGGEWRRERGGLYEKIVKEYDLGFNITNRGQWHVMPYLYTDDVLAPAFNLLDQAALAVEGESDVLVARVKFLRDGLDEFVLTRNAVAAGLRARKSKDPVILLQHEQAYLALREFRAVLTPTHAVWGDSLFGEEGIRGALTFPASVAGGGVLGDGKQDD
ncbi:MAG: DUF4838 domain-containing protein [Kiritimatiellales bacterium]